MPDGTFTRSWISHKAQVIYRGQTPPNPNKFYLGLANTNTLNHGSAIANFIAAELLPTNGYSREQILFEGSGSYNTLSERHEMPNITAEIVANGTSLQYQTVFLLANASATSAKSFTDANVNAATDRITVTNHGLVAGDRVVFTPDVSATLPGGITTSTPYIVVNPTTNDFQLETEIGDLVNITNTGSGIFYCRYASGIVMALAVEPNIITVLDGSTHSFSIPIVEF